MHITKLIKIISKQIFYIYIIPLSCTANLSTGDLAFIGINHDFALVALNPISSGETIYFRDEEWDGTEFNNPNAEGTLQWTTTSSISKGTIITFSDVSNSAGASTGTISEIVNGFGLSNGGNSIIVFVGSDEDNPTTFITAIATKPTDLDSNAADNATLNGTGLTLGVTALVLSSGSDGGAYSGNRNDESSFSSYSSKVNNVANWTDVGNSGNGESLLPFDSTSFTIIPEPKLVTSISGIVSLGILIYSKNMLS